MYQTLFFSRVFEFIYYHQITIIRKGLPKNVLVLEVRWYSLHVVGIYSDGGSLVEVAPSPGEVEFFGRAGPGGFPV